MKLKLSEITITEGRRNIDYAKVSELAESIKIVGLINPITVGKDNTLIAGAHRLEACRHLGFDKIECVVLDCDELRTELAEIDENLIRNDLDAISIGELAIRRDDILDALELRAKAGQGRPAKNGAGTAPLKTTESIAKESGISGRTLQENKQLAKNLVPEAKEAVRQKALPKSAALEIARLKPEKQREIVAKKDKKAILAKVQEKKQQKSNLLPSRRKTIAQEREGDTPQFMKIPLPFRHETAYKVFFDLFRKASDTIRDRVIAEVEALASAIHNLND
jgi:ParB family chromosome partitioning protein